MSLASLLLAAAMFQPGDDVKLTQNQAESVTTAINAYQQGDGLTVVRELASVVGEPAAIVSVETVLKQRGMPDLAKMLANARLSLVFRGQIKQLPKPGPNELPLLLTGIKNHIFESLDVVSGREVFQDPLPYPDGHRGFQESFWEIEAVRSQLENLKKTVNYLHGLVRTLPKNVKESLSGELYRMVKNDDVAGLQDAVDGMLRELTEREMELRVARLTLSVKVLEDGKLAADDVRAAATWRDDSDQAEDFLRKHRRDKPQRRVLQDDELAQKIRADAKQAGQLAADLEAKAIVLTRGLYWWLRGRYGAGPLVNGLAKAPAAAVSEQAQFPLYMPAGRVEPGDPFKPNVTQVHPQYRRRHLAWWTWDNRGIYTEAFDYDKTYKIASESTTPKKKTYISPCSGARYTHWTWQETSATFVDESSGYLKRRLIDQDDKNIRRLVGNYEYTRALKEFSRLLASASEQELEAFNVLVQEDRRFDVYVNLSRNFPQAKTTQFVTVPDKVDDDFRRSGLDWVIALARIELGAMVAGYTSVKNPFAQMRPSRFESKAFEELLVDSMRLHVWSLQNDPIANAKVLKTLGRLNERKVLTYDRRVAVAYAFTDAVAAWLGQRTTPRQRQELTTYGEALAEALAFIDQEALALGMDDFHNSQTRVERYSGRGARRSSSQRPRLP